MGSQGSVEPAAAMSGRGELNGDTGKMTGEVGCPQLSARTATPQHNEQPHVEQLIRGSNGDGDDGGGDPPPYHPCLLSGGPSSVAEEEEEEEEEDQLNFLQDARQLGDRDTYGHVIEDSGQSEEDIRADLLVSDASMEFDAKPSASMEFDVRPASMESDARPSASMVSDARQSASVESDARHSATVESDARHSASVELNTGRSSVAMELAARHPASLEPAGRRVSVPVSSQRLSACRRPVKQHQGHSPEEGDVLMQWSGEKMPCGGLGDGLSAAASRPRPGSVPQGQNMDGSSGEGSEHHCHMTQSETVTLKDKNEFIQNVSQFFNQEDISDVILKVGDNTFFAHRFVLAKSSEVFRTMLYDKRYGQAGHPELLLDESEECQSHFEAFLKYLYTAEVQICVDSAVGILCLADKYSVMSLKGLCTTYMVENTQSPHVRNALNWYSWAKALHLEDLMDSCSKTIAWNMERLVTLPEWLHMDMDFLADIISNPQLVIPNEFVLYTAVETWLLHDTHLPDLRDNCKKLLRLVHFPQMMVQQLYKVETGQLASREGSEEEIGKLLNEAYRFRSLCPFQAELGLSFNDQFFRPRNYKDLTVDTVRMHNTLRFGIQVDVRTYVGPVPSTIREGEWKITYRKTNHSWTLQVYCHDSAMVNGEARIQAVLLISDDEDRVLRVEASEETVCSRGNSLSMVIHLPPSNDAKLLTVLIKPLPN